MHKIKNTYLPFLLVSALSTIGCSLNTKSDSEREYEYVPAYTEGEPYYYQEHRINRAYIDQSNVGLEEYFRAWKEESKPIIDSDIEGYPKTIRYAYQIFEDFYEPKNLGRIANPEWGVKQFSGNDYLIVQGSLNVSVENNPSTDMHNREKDVLLDITINNFRPKIKGDTPALFLTNEYQRVLGQFLGDESYPVGYGDIMNPARAKGESEKRQSFLNQNIRIYRGHWGGWRIVTDPTITGIVFNKNMTEAIVNFSLVYEGGHAIYKYENNKWILIESRLTWIT